MGAASSLLGREEECRLIDELLARARAGRSAALVIRGEPGIGKSTLLDYARERADDFALLEARGVEAEAELAFSTLHELLNPTLALLDRLPGPQAAALASAFALGPAAPSDRFAVGAATLTLLATAAEERPLLALLDDAHWADTSSRDALFFAARRLRAESVALLVAARMDAEFAAAGLKEQTLGPIAPSAARELIARERRSEVAASVAERLFSATGGNPLALIQVAAFLTEAQLAGREPLPEPLPPVDVEAAFLARMAKLPERSQRALLVAAASKTGAMDEVAAAARTLGLEAGDLTAAEDAALITFEAGRVRFEHPLLRSAVYHAAAPDARRAAHRALAEALAATDENERRFWHLAAAATTPDEEVAAGLARAGESAGRRSDHAAAAAAFEKAARLTPERHDKGNRLLAAAEAAHLAGRYDFAAALLDEPLAGIQDERRPDAVRLRGAIDVWRGRLPEARQLLVNEAAHIADRDPAVAATLLLDAVPPTMIALEFEAALEIALRARALAARANDEMEAVAASVLGAVLVIAGSPNEGAPLLERVRPLIEGPMQAVPWLVRHFVWHVGYITLGWYGDAGRLLDASIGAARAAVAPALLPLALGLRAEIGFRTGSWHAAYSDAAESALLAEETGQSTQLPQSLSVLARVEAGRGEEESCRRHSARALELVEQQGIDALRLHAGVAVGLLELGRGRSEQAIAELEPVARFAEERGVSPAVVPFRSDLIEAYIRAGRRAEAEQMLTRLERWGRESGDAWALAGCARCRGLLASDEEVDTWFREALHRHHETTTRFEYARSQLCYGERLRRARRLLHAREPLRSALIAFEDLGARPWAERARVELRAARDVPQARRAPGLETLTAQELQVARVVGQGVRNREAASALFLSPKTIDFHLRNIYRKLGLRSRSELVRIFADGARAA